MFTFTMIENDTLSSRHQRIILNDFYHFLVCRVIGLELLAEVKRLSASLGDGLAEDDVSYSCETAGNFYLHYVLPRWEEFMDAITRLVLSCLF